MLSGYPHLARSKPARACNSLHVVWIHVQLYLYPCFILVTDPTQSPHEASFGITTYTRTAGI